jgi:basic membrane lipoprotein Med (substrate-binding protein (PBP1-ABC) superfamily)
VLREFARDGYPLIVGDAFAAEDIARRVAREFRKPPLYSAPARVRPSRTFLFSIIGSRARHLSRHDCRKLTKSNLIGTVAAMDIPEVARLTNAFCSGAKEVNPAAKCKVSFIGSFFDPPKAKEAAMAQIEAGVDAIYAERLRRCRSSQGKGGSGLLQHVDQSASPRKPW